ncbi:CoA-transferase [Bacillus nakamurai]|uniref:CoA-transferase n=1 Tax=Bacillus nakamurai TaxID=1793963 RepID=A0A150F9J2_9BACI|nr:CoA transferase subunit A [Bacillus nakamurai]KXZ18126.1 CoA-transferase [Bacillus nakamurai]KXZ21689.1 CoA-transferase [Bacillus nakamurai]MCC9021550.1 CoA transferase subunit A [Bacillus nakamurai]MCP6682088.1 CoA transferase subunit A [Bacillus nakamurai]MED1226556.1 CoA transferase subunit A [Bacillus nakamurai]
MSIFNKTVDLDAAIADVHDESVLMFGGFGGVGSPPSLIEAILESGVKELTVICNDAGFPEIGIGPLIVHKRVKRLIASHIGSNPVAGKQMTDGMLEVEFSPQGTLAERIRAGGAGLGGILTDIGIDNKTVCENKDTVMLDGRPYLIEKALKADFAFVSAHVADEFGNLTYDKTARNMNPLMAAAAKRTFAEAVTIVPTGELDSEHIVTPGVFVEGVVQSEGVKWKWAWE